MKKREPKKQREEGSVIRCGKRRRESNKRVGSTTNQGSDPARGSPEQKAAEKAPFVKIRSFNFKNPHHGNFTTMSIFLVF